MNLLLDPLSATTQGRWALDGLLLNPLASTTQGRWIAVPDPPLGAAIPLVVHLSNLPLTIGISEPPPVSWLKKRQ